MKKLALICGLGLSFAVGAGGVEWRNLDDDNHLGGRKTSEGYLRGKVVMVCKDRSKALRMGTIWQSFKTKPFVLIGAYSAAVEGCSYPMYRRAALAKNEPEDLIYVVAETGKIVYRGSDDRSATEAAVIAITDTESPKSVEQLKALLDFELEVVPGRAYLRLNEFRKKFPRDAQSYLKKAKELCAIPDVKKLSELVDFTRQAKDKPQFSVKHQAQKNVFIRKIKETYKKYKDLRDSGDPRVAQEAKNALADLTWTLLAHSR